MEILSKPELTHLKVGEHLKILQIRAMAGMGMPEHHSTHEAVIVVQQGEAILKTKDADHLLTKGSSMLVPAGMQHSLSVLKEFKAIAIMAKDSNINFNN